MSSVSFLEMRLDEVIETRAPGFDLEESEELVVCLGLSRRALAQTRQRLKWLLTEGVTAGQDHPMA
jgi:hypothetical protein